jgi:hypothetical protein
MRKSYENASQKGIAENCLPSTNSGPTGLWKFLQALEQSGKKL